MEPYVDGLTNSFINAQDQTGDHFGDNFNGGTLVVPVSADGNSNEVRVRIDQPGMNEVRTVIDRNATPQGADRMTNQIQHQGDQNRPNAQPVDNPPGNTNSVMGDLIKKTKDKTLEGLGAKWAAERVGASPPRAGWIGLGSALGSTLLDHWDELPGAAANFPSPKSFPGECDGMTCDRMD
ncbi:hypothetical protein [Fundidesulfovibrio soli]|uniref:hypothetical protein n=1 Tax=Fundidesulfovibrio soli TaxID=2922716 RepID=UPI001FAF770B|nr:hypothetical protein [Fundidesulfovibrio soli]